MVANHRPRQPATSPFTRASPLSEATNVMPSNASMKNSGEPKVSTSGRTIGMASASTRAPKTAPKSELMMAAPSARPASPFLAMGWPSTIVEAVVGSPGIPKRIDLELGPAGVGQQFRIAQGVEKRLAQHLHAIVGRARRQRVEPADRGRHHDAGLHELARFVGPGQAERDGNVGEIREWLRSHLQHDADFTTLQRLAPGRLDRLPLPAPAGDLSRLGSEPDLGGALVAADELDRQPHRRHEHASNI